MTEEFIVWPGLNLIYRNYLAEPHFSSTSQSTWPDVLISITVPNETHPIIQINLLFSLRSDSPFLPIHHLSPTHMKFQS